MPIEQIVVLAVIQGITEFLPISSSGHLILVPVLTGWADQGLTTDVMVHMGSLAAILVYFWRDVVALTGGALRLVRGQVTLTGRLAIYIVAATVPAVLFGVFAKWSGLMDQVRGGALVVAWNAIIYAVLMFAADRFGRSVKSMEQMTFMPAVLIGIAQALAIIPGTSRSGATMTAARALGFTRPEAARFSFLLGIPAFVGAGILVLGEAIEAGETITRDAALTGVLTFFTALAAIAFLMNMLRRMSLLPFVLYRLLLGGVLLILINVGLVPA